MTGLTCDGSLVILMIRTPPTVLLMRLLKLYFGDRYTRGDANYSSCACSIIVSLIEIAVFESGDVSFT